MTNHVLGTLARLRAVFNVSRQTIRELNRLGAELERFNVSTGITVCAEQAALQAALDALRQRAPVHYAAMVRELGVVLNMRAPPLVRHFDPVICAYLVVLAQVRTQLRAPLDFADRRHRETIGNALVASVTTHSEDLIDARQDSE